MDMGDRTRVWAEVLSAQYRTGGVLPNARHGEFDQGQAETFCDALDGMDYPRGLAHIGPPARRAIPALRRALTEEMHGQFFVPSGSTAATMVGALVSIHGMMGLAEWPETQD